MTRRLFAIAAALAAVVVFGIAFTALHINLNRIVVTSLDNEVFFARLFLQQDGREIDVDARPSDAIALAVRLECPIFVATDVLDRAGVIPEKEEDEQGGGGAIDEDRLAVFRDLVNSLDLPDLPDEPGSKGGQGPSSS